jgi:DNA-binding NarL/FixJ family response regulator
MSTIRVLLADDHTLVRAGIRGLLQNMHGIEVAGETGDGQEALRLSEQLEPDILLLDIAMPGLNGLEVAARLMKADCSPRVIILSMHMSEEYVLQALRAGAAGYLLKGAAVAELELAIRAVARGDMYLSPAVSKRVVDEYVSRTGVGPEPLALLTSRQREILQLVAEGHTSKEIANVLGLSYRTVETHRNQLMKRLDIHDLPALVRFAVRIGMITGEK